MHDIDRTQLESGYEAFESDFEFGFETDTESPFGEADEMELAADLLGVSTETELDQFLGSLIKRASSAVGKFIKSPTGKALGGILKGAAKQALPILGKAAGGFLGGPAGAALGGQLAGMASKTFGLELEGLSQEDQEFEVARQFVKFAGSAAKNAALAPPTASPIEAAKSAATTAAQRFAPGLLSGAAAAAGAGGGRSGRWIRRGRKIILYGV